MKKKEFQKIKSELRESRKNESDNIEVIGGGKTPQNFPYLIRDKIRDTIKFNTKRSRSKQKIKMKKEFDRSVLIFSR